MTNLWELMVLMSETHPISSKRTQLQEQLQKLSAKGTDGQEISISTDSEGWVIKIHSCYSNLDIRIHVPNNRSTPITVTDNRGTYEHD